MLDSNQVSNLMREPQGPVAKKIAAVGEHRIGVSIIVAAELRYGVAKKGSPRLSEGLDAVLDAMEVIAFEPPADARYADVRAGLEAVGKLIGANDMLIAAHALAVDATQVTDNTREFERVDGLKLENCIRNSSLAV